ncbi:hypothetical protein NG701_17010 [Pseudarthrobacter sp. HLT3-5]|uniref:hypothetical protein n=1 Tax=Pseudarthrobacter cellobiosi TaxID=2953654 RepID=UPI00208EA00C|nr:hypothetical protein [Pseudarthrobacter sp. HLT3-5]MCO4276103.1 hypothetical protein [Pseudarthrobacter sp. HLT3-5]
MSSAPAMGYMAWLGKVEAAKKVLLTSCIKGEETYFQGNTVMTGDRHAELTARRIIGVLFDTNKPTVQE